MLIRFGAITAVAMLLALSGCLDTFSNSQASPAGPERTVDVMFPAQVGGAILEFEAHHARNVTVDVGPVTLPTFLQATWIGANGIKPLLYGYEVDLRHLGEGEGVASLQIGEQHIATPDLGGLEFRLARNLVVPEGSGTLVIGWGLTAGGATIYGGAGVMDSAQAASARTYALHATPGVAVYSPVVSAGIVAQAGPPNVLLNLRVQVPSNAGIGELRVQGPGLAFVENLSPSALNSSCIDCFELHRYIGPISGSWSLEAEFAGRGAQLHVYGLAVEVPKGHSTSSYLQEWPDCVDAFSGCRP